MAWTNIPNANLAAGAPIRSVDLIALRDNFAAMANQDAGAPPLVKSINGQTGAVVNTSYGAIGSYFIGIDASIPAFQAGGGTYSPSGTVAGSNLCYQTRTGNDLENADFDSYVSAGLSGTWRRMTYYVMQDRTDLPAYRPVFMFVRIS